MTSHSKKLSSKEFLRRLYQAMNKGVVDVEELVEAYPDDAMAAGITPERYEHMAHEEKKRCLVRRIILLTGSALAVLAIIALMIRFLLIMPGVEIDRADLATAQVKNTIDALAVVNMQELINHQATALVKAKEPVATATPVEIVETDPEPTPAYLAAQFFISPYAGTLVDPPLPMKPAALWLMSVSSAELDPPEGWIDFADTAKSKGKYINDVNAAAKWRLDQPLNSEGWFALYVVDAKNYSSGQVEITLLENGLPVSTVLGSGSVVMNHSKTKLPQANAEWLWAGIYPLAYGSQIEIEMRQNGENMGWFLGVDRVALVQLTAEDRLILELATSDRPQMGMVDDGSAVNEILISDVYTKTIEDWKTVDSLWALGGSLCQPKPGFANDVRVSWIFPELLPAGKYEALAWIPSEHADATVIYSLVVNDQEIPGDSPTNGQIKQSNEGDWVSLGLWTVAEGDARISLRMVVAKDTIGEAAADVVILRKAD